ncbi:hypothetical protein GCM10027284_29470 [Cyclobacterium sediminis]
MNLIKANTDNLTSLWKIGGQLTGLYMEEPGYGMSISGNGEWPNKLWFTQPMERQAILDIQLKWKLDKLSLPVWGDALHRQELILKSCGFEEKHKQIAMFMDLSHAPAPKERVLIQKVSNKPLAEIWSQLFEQAFGYKISAITVSQTMGSIGYYIGKNNGNPVGTAVLFMDQQGIAGIHSMGIIPSQRRKGFAEELLIQIMKIAKKKGATYATLQASEMGKGLYLKTGFQQDFVIKTFIKKKK